VSERVGEAAAQGDLVGPAARDPQADAGDGEADALPAWFRCRRAHEVLVDGVPSGFDLHLLDDSSGDPGVHDVLRWWRVTAKSMTPVASPVKCYDW
jgi:hypothetical protein